MEWRRSNIRAQGSKELNAVVDWILAGDFTQDIQIETEETEDVKH